MAKVIGNSNLLETWAASGTIVQPDQTKIDSGWVPGERPPAEYMNWLQNLFGQKLNHVLRNGVPAWNAQTIYLSGDIVKHMNKLFRALDTNVNDVPPSASWVVQARDLGAVEPALGAATLKAFKAAAGVAGEPSSRVVGCQCTNDTVSPTLQLSMTAIGLLLIDGDGDAVIHRNPGTLVNDISQGAQANGFDQSAINNNVWIHFYWIWNPATATLATLSSQSPPPVGPALPAGYTHWAYACSIWKTAGLEERIWVRGNRAWRSYADPKFIEMETITGDHTFNLGGLVPPISRKYGLQATLHIDARTNPPAEALLIFKDSDLFPIYEWFVEVDDMNNLVQFDKTLELPKTSDGSQRYELQERQGLISTVGVGVDHNSGFFVSNYHLPNGDD